MKNKNLRKTAALVIAVFLFSANAKAQALKKGQWRLGIGVEGMAPLGDLEKVTKFGLGITPRLQYGLSDNVAFTFTTGFYDIIGKTYVAQIVTPTSISFVTVNGENLGIVPVKAGLKGFLSSNFYLGGEVGAGFETNGTGNIKLDLSPALGFASNDWDVSARYERLSGSGTYAFLGLRVAYSFGL
jgi:hypothetical protein